MSADEEALRAHLADQERVLDESSPGWRDRAKLQKYALGAGYDPRELDHIDARAVRVLRSAMHGEQAHAAVVDEERRERATIDKLRGEFTEEDRPRRRPANREDVSAGWPQVTDTDDIQLRVMRQARDARRGRAADRDPDLELARDRFNDSPDEKSFRPVFQRTFEAKEGTMKSKSLTSTRPLVARLTSRARASPLR